MLGQLGISLFAVTLCLFGATEALSLNSRIPDLFRKPVVNINPSAREGNGSLVQPRNETLIQPRDFPFPEFRNPSLIPPKNGSLIQPRLGARLACGNHQIAPGSSIVVESKNYPSKYPKFAKCSWTFTAPDADYIAFECTQFNVFRVNNNCKRSFVKLTADDLNIKYCGIHDYIFEYTYSTSLNVKFRANRKRRTGFSCVVAAYAYDSTSTYYSTGTTAFTTVLPTTPSTCQKCGTVNRYSRIVGGVPTDVNEYPWQVALVPYGSNSVFCGGSVYNDRYILTAAHCGKAILDNGITAQALLGAHDVNNPTSAQQRITVSQVINHPAYDSGTMDNDIALLKLAAPATLNEQVKPACLPDPANAYDNVNAIVSGWGRLTEGGSQPSELYEVDVPTMTNSACQQYYGNSISQNMICAGLPQGGKDSCQGDSGGPMVANENGRWVQIGVVSWGYGCAQPNYPGVYARVANYLPWLASSTADGGNNLCSGSVTTTTPASSSTCKCGHVNPLTRIVGGVPTTVHEYPWQVGLVTPTGTKPYCGGSIIADQWILTASHCVDGDIPSNVRVVIGEHDWTTTSETTATIYRTVDEIIMHSGYSSSTEDNDVALLKLAVPITFSSDNKIAPVCLPPAGNLYDNVQAIITGWGTTSSGGTQPSVLYEVTVPTMSNTQCQNSYGSLITSNMICAGLAAGGKDSCQGDSGGPMVTPGNMAATYMVQIGVVSWGYGCAYPNYPGVYARVNNYLNWISTNAVGFNTCPSS